MDYIQPGHIFRVVSRNRILFMGMVRIAPSRIPIVRMQLYKEGFTLNTGNVFFLAPRIIEYRFPSPFNTDICNADHNN